MYDSLLLLLSRFSSICFYDFFFQKYILPEEWPYQVITLWSKFSSFVSSWAVHDFPIQTIFSDHSRPLFSKLLFQRFLWMSMFWHAPEFQGCRVGCEIRLLACNNRLILLQKILIKEVLHFFSKWRVMALKICPVPKVLVFKGYFVLWFCPQPCQHN